MKGVLIILRNGPTAHHRVWEVQKRIECPSWGGWGGVILITQDVNFFYFSDWLSEVCTVAPLPLLEHPYLRDLEKVKIIHVAGNR